ncbi:MAG: glycosyltransferase [Victivallaceae bacterium]|nr:glycosyltransferase [Victivallaceae bacterium]
MKQDTVALLIPAYHPEPEKFQALLRDAICIFDRILVVDDGSDNDAFAELPSGVIVVHHTENRGKGAALKTGFAALLRQFPELLGCVTADADGQHSFPDILRVAEAAKTHPDCLILGARDFHKTADPIPFRSRFGNQLTEIVFHLCTRRHVHDTQTGLRFYPAQFMRRCLDFSANGYEFELENLVYFARNEPPERLIEVPIKTVYEADNPTSHFRAVRDSLRIYFVLLRFVLMTIGLSLLDHLAFALFSWGGLGIFAAMLSARIPNLVLYFYLARKFVFRSDGKISTQLPKFLLLAGGLFAASYYGVSFWAGKSAIHPTLAKIFFETGLFVASFLIQLFLIFRRGRREK